MKLSLVQASLQMVGVKLLALWIQVRELILQNIWINNMGLVCHAEKDPITSLIEIDMGYMDSTLCKQSF